MKKKVSDSKSELVYQLRPEHLNGAGRLFGGQLMQWIDEIAGLAAMRHCRTHVITASIDRLNFIRGAYLRDMVVLTGKVVYVGRTSLEIKVDVYTEELDGTRNLMTQAFVTMVSIDEDDRPMEAPGLILETQEEQMEWRSAQKRKELRALEKKNIE